MKTVYGTIKHRGIAETQRRVNLQTLTNYVCSLGVILKRLKGETKMKAVERTTIDGHEYDPGEEIWDLGGWECDSIDTEGRRTYLGNEVMAKLPPYAPLGSEAISKSGNVYKKFPDGWAEL